MKFSILVPSYNQAQYLEQTLHSIFSQTYSSFEVLVADGGSTDGSVDILEKYSSRLAWWVSERDGGQAHALNKAYAHATGDYLAWQNSDDTFEPYAFERAAAILAAHPDVDFLYGHHRLIDERSAIVKSYYAINFDITTKLYENTIVYNQALFWRKSFSDRMFEPKVGRAPFNENLRFVMDAEFVFRAYQRGAVFRRAPYFFGSFRTHSTNKTSTLDDVFQDEYLKVRKALFREFSLRKEKCLRLPLKIRRHLLAILSRMGART